MTGKVSTQTAHAAAPPKRAKVGKPKLRSDGDGSVYKRGVDGRWVASYPMPPGPDGRRSPPKMFYGNSDDEARKKRRAWLDAGGVKSEAEGRVARRSSPHMPTVAELGGLWLEWLDMQGKRETTGGTYRSHLKTHVAESALAPLKVDRVKSEHIEELYRSMKKKGGSLRMRQAVHCTLNGLFKDGVRRKFIERSPMDGIKRPGGARQATVKPIDRTRIWTIEETLRFLEVCRNADRHYGPMFECMLGTGIRPGEAFAVKREVLDRKAQTLRVAWQLAIVNGEKALVPPKQWSRRTLHLAETTCKMFDALGDGPPSEFLFTASNGEFCDRNNVARALKDYALEAGVPVLTPHELRHTHASQLLARKIDIKVVSQRLGHKDVKTTYDIYQHLLPGMDESAANEIDAMFAQEGNEGSA